MSDSTDVKDESQTAKFDWTSLSSIGRKKRSELIATLDKNTIEDNKDNSNNRIISSKYQTGDVEETLNSQSLASQTSTEENIIENQLPQPIANGTQATDIKTSSWWIWATLMTGQSTSNVRDENCGNDDQGEGWSDWIPFMRSFNSGDYKPHQESNVKEMYGLPKDSNFAHDVEETGKVDLGVKNSKSSGWLSWIWPERESADKSLEDSDALFKSARASIEGSKDDSHHAYRSLSLDPTFKEFELAVSNTHTAKMPVKNNSRKRPLTQNEVQERSLKVRSQDLRKGSNSQDAIWHKRSLALPHIYDNLRILTIRTRLRLLGESIFYKNNTSEMHLYRSKHSLINKRKEHAFKKIVIIGVHGFLPTKMVRTLIGDCTGNSIRYVNEAMKAIKQWFGDDNKSIVRDRDIQTIALDGEGKIDDRVSNLLLLLENWMDIITDSDFVFFVSHSQGVPVSIHLLAELLRRHHLQSKKIGLLAMSGPFCGPFSGLDSKLVIRAFTSNENNIINEIFELQKPNSIISLKLKDSMSTLIDNNVKITLSGAVNDQWIPIFSSLGYSFDHPNIYRFLYVNSKSDIPHFITSLLNVLTIMKNMGYSDQNLIRNLSDKCMGSLYDGGHCDIFKIDEVYSTAIKHSLETTSLYHHRDLSYTAISNNKSTTNLFVVPWVFRGLIHELLQIKSIPGMKLVSELVKDFQSWSPFQKQWRELKHCFDALDDLDLEELVP